MHHGTEMNASHFGVKRSKVKVTVVLETALYRLRDIQYSTLSHRDKVSSSVQHVGLDDCAALCTD